MKFDWLLLKGIHLDVNITYYGNFPVKFDEVLLITAKVINEIGVKFDWVLLKVIHLDVNSDVNSQPFSM